MQPLPRHALEPFVGLDILGVVGKHVASGKVFDPTGGRGRLPRPTTTMPAAAAPTPRPSTCSAWSRARPSLSVISEAMRCWHRCVMAGRAGKENVLW